MVFRSSRARRVAAIMGGTLASLLLATSVMAHECVNANKQVAAGVQVVFGLDDQIVWVSDGLAKRIEKGVVDPETGEGFHGLVGFDMDGDGSPDLSTYLVGPDGEIPVPAQLRGPACKGITNLFVYFEQCMGT
jgi:hypothetical protein